MTATTPNSKTALERYQAKRRFDRTPEPEGNGSAREKSRSRSSLRFVVQKHAARRLHYDFRLEHEGVLRSWAIPKGPSHDPTVKRLAVETEPHPIAYGTFEGNIPKGEYGAGAVIVWDHGTFEPEGEFAKAYAKGHLAFTLHGKKLHGHWHLVRTRKAEDTWLLFKAKDGFAKGEDTTIDDEPASVLTGLTVESVANGSKGSLVDSAKRSGTSAPKRKAGPGSNLPLKRSREVQTTPTGSTSQRTSRDPQGDVDNAEPSASRKRRRKLIDLDDVAGAERTPPAQMYMPQLATLVERPPEGTDFCHEIKFDGYRVLAQITAGQVRLWTRNGNDWTAKFPGVASALQKMRVETAWLDGELVALEPSGRSNFQLLQNALSGEIETPLAYYVFDVLYLDGHDLRRVHLAERKNLLKLCFSEALDGEVIRLSEFIQGEGRSFFDQARALGLEGVVSKRLDSAYVAGRGRDWLKSKCTKRQEFVILGYTDPAGSRSHLGALLLGVREGDRFRYVGRVGTGFNEATLRKLKTELSRLERPRSKDVLFPGNATTRGVHWVTPKLVAEITFTTFTDEGMLRHASFEGLRADKKPQEVVLEVPSTKAPMLTTSTTRRPVDYPLSHPEKVLYPEQGITKRQLLEYYDSVADRILPLIANRPLSLVRCPSGFGKACFFQKHPTEKTPEGLRFVQLREGEGKAPYAVVDDRKGLFALVQMGVLEIHTWGSTADDIEHPNLLVFDLDPDPSLPFSVVVEGAQRLRRLFEAAKLQSFPKTTGGKGLHVCVPILPEYDWPVVKDFSRRVAEELSRESPQRYVATQSKALRKGKIYIDYLRNARGATSVAPYSTRARDGAPVAVPLEWDEVTDMLVPSEFTVQTLERRLARQRVDPFARMAQVRQRLVRG